MNIPDVLDLKHLLIFEGFCTYFCVSETEKIPSLFKLYDTNVLFTHCYEVTHLNHLLSLYNDLFQIESNVNGDRYFKLRFFYYVSYVLI